MSYGRTITQTSFDGTMQRWCVSGQATPEEATRIVVEWATKDGWRNPRWWEWWRWSDTRIVEDEETAR